MSASGWRISLYDGRGLAKSNADQVRRIRTILEALSLEVATPAEAREMLALKGGDRVAFLAMAATIVRFLPRLPVVMISLASRRQSSSASPRRTTPRPSIAR